MPALTPLNLLLVGIVFILLILLGLLWANKRAKARHQATQYRTANGTLIDKQTKAIQNLPMATRRVRAGKMVPLERATQLHRLQRSREQHLADCAERGKLASLHDQAMGRNRQPSPFTEGSEEHSFWVTGYLNAPKGKTVQTTARRAEEPAAA